MLPLNKTIRIFVFACFIPFISYSQIEIFISRDGSDLSSGNISSPLATFNVALEKANKIWADRDVDITIYFRKGTYRLQSPIDLNPDQVKNRENTLIIAGYDNQKPVLSGGIQLNSWIKESDFIFKSIVNKLNFRQVYVNGNRAIRAREPNSCSFARLNWDTINQKFLIPKLIQNINSDPQNPIEIFIQKIWAGQIFRIQAIREYNSSYTVDLVPQDRSVFNTRKYQIRDQQSFHLENHMSFMNSDDEWYINPQTGYLYYYCSQESNFLDSNIEIPVLDHIISIYGSTEERIQNIVVRDLILELSNFTYPDSKGYYVGQANYVYDLKESQLEAGAILVKHAKNVRILNNEIRKFGATGIMFYSDVKNSSIKNNFIHNGSGNGIVIDWYLKGNEYVEKYCQNITIESNLISNIGHDYLGSVAIFSGYADSVKIEKNMIINVPYTGISIGWGHTANTTNLKNNSVQFNYINKAMSLMSDGGGIYTLSSQPGTLIQKNFIENIIQSKWSWGSNHVYGIYLDKGSDFINVKDNIIENTTVKYTINSERSNNILKDHTYTIDEFSKENNLYSKMDSLVWLINTDQNCYTEKDNIVLLMPNPIKNEFFIKIINNNYNNPNEIKYEIYSRYGSLLKDGLVVKKSNSIYSGNLEDLKPDIYLLKFYLKNIERTLRIIYDPAFN